jgi:hypothetical protein
MPNCWQPSDWKKFERQAQMGRDYYVRRAQARNLAPYEDDELYDVYRFTEYAPFTGHKATANLGTTAGQLCRLMGPVYDTKPAGMRRMGSPGPQVEGPLPKGYEGDLTDAEIRDLERRVAKESDPRKRRRLGSWRV